MSVIAKGARQSKSKYQGILESINLLEVVVYISATRKLQILGEISLEDSFRKIRVDYDKTGYAFALLELTDIFFKEGDDVPVLTNIAVIGADGETYEDLRPSSKNESEEVEELEKIVKEEQKRIHQEQYFG